jgi:hypothetical protein
MGVSAMLTRVPAVVVVEMLLKAVVAAIDELVVVGAVEWPADDEQPTAISRTIADRARPADSQRDLGCPTASTMGPTRRTVTVPSWAISSVKTPGPRARKPSPTEPELDRNEQIPASVVPRACRADKPKARAVLVRHFPLAVLSTHVGDVGGGPLVR